MIDEKKLIEDIKLEIKCMNAEKEKYFQDGNFRNGNIIVEQVSAIKIIKKIINNQPKIGEWIPCSERLPEEPEEIPTEGEFIEEMILDGKFKEYIVTIWGADKATTLYYIGNNEWYDSESGECYYKPIAWQPLPEAYKV